MEQKGLKVKRIDIGSTLDPVTVENAALAKANLAVERMDAATEAEIVAAAKDAEIILTRYAQMSRSVVEKLPKLLAIIRYGIGYDTIDVDAATDNRVLVVNVPDF
jgi:D-3-phosphoglycerate dehydrogenase / 2-oxoglutarate reductase